ncbi:hypothetical protein ACIRS3_00245 [Streptomyces virginiae]|uniref:hypothetical protein n=1 Tax=Streptomyces virginiae TaxID=1961 RepID=UPI00380F3C38
MALTPTVRTAALPADHALGRSREVLSTKVHPAADGRSDSGDGGSRVDHHRSVADTLDVLELRIVCPPTTEVGVEVRPIIGVRDVFADSPYQGIKPRHLLGSAGLLRATAAPRKVRIAKSGCVEECCGAVHVTIRREMEQVQRPGRSGGATRSPADRRRSLCHGAGLGRFPEGRREARIHLAAGVPLGLVSRCPQRAFDTGSGCREWSAVKRPLRELAEKHSTFRLDMDKRLDLLPALAPGSRRAADDGVPAAGSVSGG